MALKSSVSDEARADLRAIADYYKDQEVAGLVARFYRAFQSTRSNIELYPYSAPRMKNGMRRAVFVGGVFPYYLFYDVMGEEIKIISVQHQYRHQPPEKEM